MSVRFPHPLVLLLIGILLAAGLSYLLPAGQFERRDDPATGRSVVVAGTYHPVEPTPVGPFEAIVAIPRGMADAADVIFLVFLVGGAFMVVDQTGALRRGVDSLVRRLQDRELLVIPVVSLAFATGGVLQQMQEEIIALVPVLLLLTRRMGYDALTAAAMSIGAAAVGAAFSPINPFQVGIAQRLAELPLLSGGGYRMVFLALALAAWIGGTMRYAARTRTTPEAAEITGERLGGRDGAVLALVAGTFALFVVGVLRLGWGFHEMSALFFVMGVLAGLIGRLGVRGTTDAYLLGFREMAFAALLIGFARAIFVVLQDGQIIDTLVSGLFAPIAELPVSLSAFGMMIAQALIHFPVPSTSGQAVLTLPVLVPLSDLLGLSRQVTVLAYQYGAGLTELITPTNGALMAVLAAAGVGFERWLKFTLPLFAALFALGALAVGLGIALGV